MANCLAAPRLVEYWEQDPCNVIEWKNKCRVIITSHEIRIPDRTDAAAAKFGVKIESRFSVGKYDVLILSAKHPRAVVTEYSWSAASCDPCPEPPLDIVEMSTLGLDVLPQFERTQKVLPHMVNDYTLTRLHARYDSSALGEDLIFRAAPGH